MTGYVANSDDCDDTLATVNPGATEVCNGIDDNCSGAIDDLTTCGCTYEERQFDVKKLKVKYGTAATSLDFDAPISDPKFTVFNIGQRKGRFSDKVTITYTHSDGT